MYLSVKEIIMTERKAGKRKLDCMTADEVKDLIIMALQPLVVQLTDAMELTKQNDRTLRGNNGTPGVLAKLDVVTNKMTSLEEKVEEGSKMTRALQESLQMHEDKEFSYHADVSKKLEILETLFTSANLKAKIQEDNKDNAWQYIVEKMVFPIVIPGIVFILYTVMPKIFILLDK
jgi:hypothetical protein